MSHSAPPASHLGTLSQRVRGPAAEAVLVGLAVAAIHALARMSDLIGVGSFHDDGVYMALGKSIADGTGYRSIYTPGDPVHLKYPPGLPLILATLWKVGGTLDAVTRLHGVLTLGAVGTTAACLWWLARTELKLDAFLILLVGMSPLLLEGPMQYYHLVLSEPHFLAAWAAGLVTYAAVRRRREHGGPTLAPAAALGLIVAWTALLRTQGLVLVPAILAALRLDRLRGATVTAFTATALGPIAIWTAIHRVMVTRGPVSLQPDEMGYASWLQVSSVGEAIDLAGRSAAFNWTWYWRDFPGSLVETRLAGIMLVTALALLAVLGAVVAFRRQSPLVLTVAATIALIALWPWPQDRFVYGFLPVAALLAGTGLEYALERCSRPVVLGVKCALALIALLALTWQMEIRRAAYRPGNPRLTLGVTAPGYTFLANTRYLIAVSQWVRANTGPDDRLMVDSPAAVYLYTGRKAVNASPGERGVGRSAFEVPSRYVAERVINEGVTVVIPGSPQLAAGLRSIEERCPGMFAVAATREATPSVRAYRVVGDRACLQAMTGDDGR